MILSAEDRDLIGRSIDDPRATTEERAFMKRMKRDAEQARPVTREDFLRVHGLIGGNWAGLDRRQARPISERPAP
jgi:hypothetical protein